MRPFGDINSRSPAHSGLPHPTASTFRVSHPLGGFLLPEPSGLISCQSHPWVFPSRAFPPCRAFSSFQSWLPSWCYKSAKESEEPTASAPTFKALLTARIPSPRPSVSLPKSGCPPGFHLSREFPSRSACSRSHNPFLGFPAPAQCEHCERTPTLQGFNTTGIGLPLSRLPSLMSFLHRPRPASSILCHPWLMNSPWLQALLPALANQLGISRLPTGALLL